jgi:hypothetical protein
MRSSLGCQIAYPCNKATPDCSSFMLIVPLQSRIDVTRRVVPSPTDGIPTEFRNRVLQALNRVRLFLSSVPRLPDGLSVCAVWRMDLPDRDAAGRLKDSETLDNLGRAEGRLRVNLCSSGCRCEGPLIPAVRKYG